MTRDEMIAEVNRIQSLQDAPTDISTREGRIAEVNRIQAQQEPKEVAPVNQEPTLEEQTGSNRLYAIADKLKYLDNFRSKAFASTIGPVLDIGAGKSPYPAFEKEASTFEPQAESSFMGRLRNAFPNQKPIIDTPAEDIVQGQGMQGMAKTYAQKEFPNAYGFVSNIVPSDIPGGILDAVTGKLVLPHVPQEGVVNSLDSSAEANRATGLLRNSDLAREKNIEMTNNSKMKIIGNTLNKYGVADQISDPEKLHTTLNGESGIKYDEIGRQRDVQSKGLIAQLSSTVKDAAEHFSQELGEIDVNKMATDVLNQMSGEASKKTSLVPFDSMSESKLIKTINDKLKLDQHTGFVSFGDLIEMKRNAADAIYEIKNNAATYGIQGVTDLKMNKAIWSWIDNTINEMATKNNDPNVKGFVLANSDLSDLLTARDITAGAKTSNLSAASGIEALGMAGLGLAAGEAVGHPVVGASIGGGFGAGRAVMKDVSNQIPSRVGSLQQNAADFLRPGKGMNRLTPAATVGAVANIPSAQQQLLMRKGIVENLADYEIPRNVDELMQNKDLAMAKIAQVTNDPNIVNMVDDALNKHPDKASDMLRVLSIKYPNIMTADKYDRVDNKIFNIDPMLKQQMIHQAYKDVENNSSLSNTEKVMLQNGLNRDGSLPMSYK